MNPNWIEIAIENAQRDAESFPSWALNRLPEESGRELRPSSGSDESTPKKKR